MAGPSRHSPAPPCLICRAPCLPHTPQVPRMVSHIFLTSGNRAELLVRCARPGTYTLTAGRRPSPFGPGFSNLSWFRQKVVLTLRVASSKRKVREHRKQREQVAGARGKPGQLPAGGACGSGSGAPPGAWPSVHEGHASPGVLLTPCRRRRRCCCAAACCCSLPQSSRRGAANRSSRPMLPT